MLGILFFDGAYFAMTLIFWRYTTHNDTNNIISCRKSHKLRQAAKSAKKRLRERVQELGYNPNIWTFEELSDYGSELDDDIWDFLRNDSIIQNCFSKIKENNWKKSFHSPPRQRGLYAFPPKYVERFLVLWKKQDFPLRKTTIKYSKPTLWCHFEKIALIEGITILNKSGSWIEVYSSDYPYLLKKAIKHDIKEFLKDNDGELLISSKNLAYFVSLDHYEVFLV